VLAGLSGTTLVAWGYLIHMARGMDTMPMDPAAMGVAPWTPADALWMFAMWAVMMVGMMVPSAAPTTLVYAAVARKASREGTPVAPTSAFVAGYVCVWTLFSIGATLAQWALDQAALLSPMLVTTSPIVGALLLGAAGLYQLTPAKQACLRHCRSPAEFISGHWRPGVRGAFRLGLLHGAFCLGCCWALMGLLFFGGVMNLVWIAAITGFVLVEKLLPYGPVTARAAGLAMLGLGAALAARAWA
jgi:predicted metal-binding membrane protein